jgi:hypothetical protein
MAQIFELTDVATGHLLRPVVAASAYCLCGSQSEAAWPGRRFTREQMWLPCHEAMAGAGFVPLRCRSEASLETGAKSREYVTRAHQAGVEA